MESTYTPNIILYKIVPHTLPSIIIAPKSREIPTF